MTVILASIGRVVNDALSGAGRGLLLLRAIILQTPHAWRMRREILEQMQVVAIGSLPLVIVTSIFVGAVTAVQAVYQMQAYVPMKFLGTVISKSVFIELGPVLMALVVGSRLCANYAAELGTMKVTEQLDAMTIMAIDPTRYLAMPRFWLPC
jgi:phospholipid/cholesterol/gamma-HCH transport system permease protein